MATVGDKITDTRNAARPVSTTVAAPRSAGGTTLTCASLTGWPTASKIHGVTYQIDSNSNPVAGTQIDFYGIVSGSAITQFTVVDGSDIGNSIGDVVEMLPTAAWGQDLADALTNQHTRTGAHKGITTDTIVVTSGTTLPAGDIGTADIADSAITNAKLLSTIFSGQVQTQANAGTAGGTIYYVNLGGIKLCWGTSISKSSFNSPTYTVTLPTSFFSTIQGSVVSAVAEGTDGQQTASILSITTATINIEFTNRNNSAGGTQTVSYFVIGT